MEAVFVESQGQMGTQEASSFKLTRGINCRENRKYAVYNQMEVICYHDMTVCEDSLNSYIVKCFPIK